MKDFPLSPSLGVRHYMGAHLEGRATARGILAGVVPDTWAQEVVVGRWPGAPPRPGAGP